MSILRKWETVSKDRPCIGCRHSDWCRTNGIKYFCYREQNGSIASKQDKNGSPYYVHVSADSPPPPSERWTRPATPPPKAEPATLHDVYSAFLDQLTLDDQHRVDLHQRGLSDSVIDRNGYKSLPGPGRSNLARSLQERFGKELLTVPGFFVQCGTKGDYVTFAGPAGIVIPVRNFEGLIVALKVRRDDGKEPKYCYCSSSKHGGPSSGAPAHVPLGTPKSSENLRLTEGELKADVAFALDGKPTISIAGVTNWRPAIDVITALGCKAVCLALDSDADENPNVAKALAQIMKGLQAFGLIVSLELWDKSKGKGIDDFLATGGQTVVLQGDEAQGKVSENLTATGCNTEANGQTPIGLDYYFHNNSTFRIKRIQDNEIPILLANFAGQIVEECLRDDGTESTLSFAIEGRLSNGSTLARVSVPATEFNSMNWTTARWGSRAVVAAGVGAKDHLRVALQFLSGSVPRRTVYVHTGWRRINDQWVYLHAGGAIGTNGPVDESVELPVNLGSFEFPIPPEGDELRRAVLASLAFVNLGPERLTIPLLAAAYRSVLGGADFSVHVSGPTGAYKSEAAALIQQHFGHRLDARHLPGSWSSTGNALEMLAFTIKDAIMVVDDFCPAGSSADVQRYHREADRLFRGQGNHAGRQRLRSDAELRPMKPPRGLIVSTGETNIKGQSLNARILTLDVEPGDFGPKPPEANPNLDACQNDASNGLYASAMAGFVQWVAPQYDSIRTGIAKQRDQLRADYRAADQHARTPTMLADLACGWNYFLDFAEAVSAITNTEKLDLLRRGRIAFIEAGTRQAEHIAVSEPAAQFVRLLFASIAAGEAHVANQDGGEPPDPARWGWRSEETSITRYRSQGTRVGWLADDELYLEPDAAFAAVQDFAERQGDSIFITPLSLRRRLKEKGFLVATDEARGKITIRKVLQGERRDVLHLRYGSATGPNGPSTEVISDNGSNLWA